MLSLEAESVAAGTESQVSTESTTSHVVSDAGGVDDTDSPDTGVEILNEHCELKIQENDLLTSLTDSSSVQSQADVTPKGDVGGCKRSNADSGFQEGPYDDEKQKRKDADVSEEWDAEKVTRGYMYRACYMHCSGHSNSQSQNIFCHYCFTNCLT